MKKIITIEQPSLFGGAKEPKGSSSSYIKSTAFYKPVPDTTLLTGLDKTALKTEGVYLLRILANQYSRTFPAAQAKKKLLKTVETEINLKKGELPIEVALMDSLLRRHF